MGWRVRELVGMSPVINNIPARARIGDIALHGRPDPGESAEVFIEEGGLLWWGTRADDGSGGGI